MNTFEMIAAELDLNHLLCDPTYAERNNLGIIDRRNSIATGRYDEEPETIIDERIRNEMDKREDEWLLRINNKISNFPILFVCGANHCDSFKEKAENNGYDVVILTKEWK